MFPETVETDSLVLRRLSPEYVDVFELYDLYRADADGVEDVFEHVPMEPYTTVEDARDWLTGAREEWEEGAVAKFAVFEDGEELADTAALTPDWEKRTGRLAVILAKPYWGRGYAGECAMALTEVAFDRLDLELVALGYDAGNERSQRAIEKFVDRVGGQYDGVLRNATPRDGEVVDAHRYTVSRREYRNAIGEP